MRTIWRQSCILITGFCFAGCSGTSQESNGPGANSGGSAPTGGSTVNGGSSASGGTSANGGSVQSAGGTSKGGSSAGTGGIAATGGSAAGGISSTGGAATTGGATAVGGTSTAGGATSPTGGSKASGGISSAGGAQATGGSSALGGTNAAGGTNAVGGTVATTGGTKASGGTTATGGATGTGGATTCAPPTVNLTGSNAVAGTLIQFNDNGAWCWYQDERALVDTKANKLLIGSVASGGSRDGDIEAVIYDLAKKTGTRYTVSTSLTSVIDDHNAPAFVIRPDGEYLAMYCSHRNDCITRASIFDGTKWGAEYKFDWTSLGCPWPSTSTPNTNLVTYNNPWYMGTSIYDGVRSVNTDNAFLSSSDNGATFSYYGRLMDTKQVGYVAGYYKYWGNNTDRIDFVGTEAHPRDYDNSLWHGYIQGGQVYNSAGTVIDSSLKDPSSTTTNSKDISAYTQAFATGTSLNGVTLCRMWDHDIVRYADGTIAILGQGRTELCTSTPTGSDPDKRMIYLRWDGTSWKATYLVHGGPKLYATSSDDEEDYIGLAALVPDDPTTIYVSTTYDPRTDTVGSSGKHEIWRGTTCDNGATFQWTPVTANSTKDNLRPIVPKWDSSHTALLWMQGTYSSAQSYAMAIVGIISGQ